MIASGYTLNGIKHKKNQDNFLIRFSDETSLFIVADGMGGHAAGDIASMMAIDIIQKNLDGFSEKSIQKAVFAANEAILAKAKEKEEYKGMGTTLAMCLVKGKELFVAHIGDSRVYIDKGHGDTFVTKDHSLVQQLVDKGEISGEEAKEHTMKNVITRALGVEENVQIETEFTDMTDDTVIVICSDGVSNVIDNSLIWEIAAENEPEDAARILCSKARENGSTDDITAIVIKSRGDK